MEEQFIVTAISNIQTGPSDWGTRPIGMIATQATTIQEILSWCDNNNADMGGVTIIKSSTQPKDDSWYERAAKLKEDK